MPNLHKYLPVPTGSAAADDLGEQLVGNRLALADQDIRSLPRSGR
jgi:hypothetical protein